MSELHQLFIGGAWHGGSAGTTGAVLNPATEDIVARVAHASREDVQAAMDAAIAALPLWRRTSATDRAAVLARGADYVERHLDAAARQLTREQGKTLAESRQEFQRAIDTLRWHAGTMEAFAAPRHDDVQSWTVLPEPIGVVAAFTPWNYPAVIVARKLSAALAARCTVVLKGAEEAPSPASLICRALEAGGLPRGAVNLVFGDPPAISDQILASKAVQAFSFTGSTAVGKQLAARAALTLKRCVLELGGHAPVLVFEDADIATAVAAIAAYKFECAGQSCNAPSRIYVEATRYEEFVKRFVAVAENIRTGDGTDPHTQMGPLATSRRLAAIQQTVDDVRDRGGRVLTGGERLARPGYFWAPTVCVDVPQSATLVTEEPFGPIVSIAPFSTVDEAVTLANRTAYGLAGYVFTASPDTARAVVETLQVGSVGVNSLAGVPPDVGIAGVKDSGYGYEGGHLGVEAFLNLKVVRGDAGMRLHPQHARPSGACS